MISSYAYAEVLEVLENMNKIYVNKIPKKLLEKIKNNASTTYKKHINPSINLASQNISIEALNILAVINLKYWTENEYQRNRLLKIYRENDNISKKNVRKIKLNEVFEQYEIKEEKVSRNIVPIVQKDTIWNKILSFIKKYIKGEHS